jgi:acyl-CoA thioester hydrolase
MEHLLSCYPVVIEFPVAWGEMDSFQHVNNVVYMRYFENARIAYFHKVDMIADMNRTGIGPILASTSCRYKMPLTYPDVVLVGARVKHVDEYSFMMGYCVFSKNHQRVAAEGDGLLVTFDYNKNKKVHVPEELRRRIMALEDTKCASE